MFHGTTVPTKSLTDVHGPLIRYVKFRVAHAPKMPGTFPLTPRLNDPDMHHCTCVMHVAWCMPGLLTSGFKSAEKTLPAFSAHAHPSILRIWQGAHANIPNPLAKLYKVSTRTVKRNVRLWVSIGHRRGNGVSHLKSNKICWKYC